MVICGLYYYILSSLNKLFGTITALVCCCAVKKPTNKQTNTYLAATVLGGAATRGTTPQRGTNGLGTNSRPTIATMWPTSWMASSARRARIARRRCNGGGAG